MGVLLTLLGAVLVLGSAERPALHRMVACPQEYAGCGVYCGTERWSVKTLTDADRHKVDFEPKEATVGWLVSLRPPARLPADGRVAPIETQTYKVRARLVGYKLERDEDSHVVIADMEDPNKTMIVEIPSPDCAGACASGYADEFRKVRAAITQRLGWPTEAFAEIREDLTVVLTGVGFFDFLHAQTGVATNGIELHPVLKIEFKSSPRGASTSSGGPVPRRKRGKSRSG